MPTVCTGRKPVGFSEEELLMARQEALEGITHHTSLHTNGTEHTRRGSVEKAGASVTAIGQRIASHLFGKSSVTEGQRASREASKVGERIGLAGAAPKATCSMGFPATVIMCLCG